MWRERRLFSIGARGHAPPQRPPQLRLVLPSHSPNSFLRVQLGDADCSDTAVDILPEREQIDIEQMDGETQTEARAMLNAATQSRSYKSSEVQTSARLADMTPEEFERIRIPLDQIDDMAMELEKCGISHELIRDALAVRDQNTSSNVFHKYDVEWDAAPPKVARLHTLRCAPREADAGAQKSDEGRSRRGGGKKASSTRRSEADADADEYKGIPVAGVCWNSSGNMLAVCYGRMDLKGTDQQTSCVGVWNLKRVFVQPDKPDHRLETSCSVISVAFHPKHPAILVAGTYGGEVLAWNLGNDADETSISVLKGERAHREAVTGLEWSKDPIQQDYKLVSCSSDGKVVLWKLKDMDLDSLWPVASFNMVPDTDAAKQGLELAHRAQRAKALGLTSLAFDKHGQGDEVTETGVFLVGTETGGVFKCLLNLAHVYDRVPKEIRFSAVPAPDVPMEMKSPITFSYAPHFGPVHAVAFSRLQRNVFASCGADGTIRIHNAQQQASHLSLEPSLSYAYSLAWSPSKPLVLAVGSGAGKIFVYNLAVDKVKPVETLQLTAGSNVGAVAFSTDGERLAAGDWTGVSCVWSLNKGLSRSSPSDAADVARFGAAARRVGDS